MVYLSTPPSNNEQNICRQCHVSAQFCFTKSESELDYYHQKVNVRVVSGVVGRLRPRVLGNWIPKKALKSMELMASPQPATLNPNFDSCARKLCKKAVKSCKTFQKKSYFTLFCERVLKNFAKFTWKHQSQSLIFDKVASLRPVTLLKKRFWYRCFPVNSAKFLRTPFL